MEFLVTMTTRVPEGTSDRTVETVRRREATRARELALEGQLLRLWRPPLRDGERRSIGLFAAPDADQLEARLASMPLRVWRTDEVQALAPHPNDPATASTSTPASTEFLTTFTISIPPHTAVSTIRTMTEREAARARELATLGLLSRLWMLPGWGRALGLWRAANGQEMTALLDSLPLSVWMAVATVPLRPHPSDPAATRSMTPASQAL